MLDSSRVFLANPREPYRTLRAAGDGAWGSPVLDGADLSAVALEVGYSSHSHFTAAFRREFGVTPSRFRRAAATRALGNSLVAARSRSR